jgi:hypothetical protein
VTIWPLRDPFASPGKSRRAIISDAPRMSKGARFKISRALGAPAIGSRGDGS